MTFHVVDRDERLLPEECKRFGEINTDPERRFKSWTCGNGDDIYFRWFTFGNEFKK